MNYIHACLLGLWLFAGHLGAEGEGEDEKRLVHKLLEGYHIEGRPVRDASMPLKVNISFGLIEIQNFDQQKQELTIVGWTALGWQDYQLMWNASTEEHITHVAIDPGHIWTPDVMIMNSIDKADPIHETRAYVDSNGHVSVANAYRYRVFCTTKPDDDQPPCKLRFASWSMDMTMLALSPRRDRVDTSNYVSDLEWELFRQSAVQKTYDLPWADGRRVSVAEYELNLKRRHAQVKDDCADKDSSAFIARASGVAVTILASFVVINILLKYH